MVVGVPGLAPLVLHSPLGAEVVVAAALTLGALALQILHLMTVIAVVLGRHQQNLISLFQRLSTECYFFPYLPIVHTVLTWYPL